MSRITRQVRRRSTRAVRGRGCGGCLIIIVAVLALPVVGALIGLKVG